ncbi:FAD:protein FMN transferase [Algivirga pacifica]|uniref:FAD:protein FMN transferase n=2 Tax=Algivirga pacifica TaxID=1162670 RepID=A0ABP9D5R2_9BACT
MGTVWLYRQYYGEKAIHFYIEGQTMGTTYHIKYIDQESRKLKEDIDELLKTFNQSMSTYIPTSEISRFNKGGNLSYELPYFYPVLEKSAEVYKVTDGAFDPTVMPLVQAWGFGPARRDSLATQKVDSLLDVVGFDYIEYNEQSVKAAKPNVQLDFSAIAKGYGADVVADYLKGLGITNYMVEIGGEVVCKGVNENKQPWRIGIDNPLYNEKGGERASAIVALDDKAIATSGNYRNFYIKDGKKYAHTIDPRTGYPVRHSLLSASVFAKDCMTADAYATSFMVLGVDTAIKIADENPEIEVLLIYADGDSLSVHISEGIKPFITL